MPRDCGPEGGIAAGPNPVDRGKPGSKIHVLSDRAGLPLSLAVPAANLHDSQAFEPTLALVAALETGTCHFAGH